jgi:hypothetical protein
MIIHLTTRTEILYVHQHHLYYKRAYKNSLATLALKGHDRFFVTTRSISFYFHWLFYSL